jgi:hypothetical protein
MPGTRARSKTVRRPQSFLATRGLPGALAVKLFPNWFTLNVWSKPRVAIPSPILISWKESVA